MAADVTVAPTLGHAILMTQGGIGATPGYDAIDLRRMIQAASGSQEGVYNATGWEVRENAGGANMTVQVDANVGLARVDGESVTNQGPYVVAPHSAVITLDVTAAHATNPRIDMVILHVRDNTHDALGSNDARVRILTGTATSGATLDNRTGAPALPVNTLRLADVLVPALDTTISNAQIRDRRQWALGAYTRVQRTAGNIAVSATTPANLDSTNLYPRIECSGAPIKCRLDGYGFIQNTGSSTNHFDLWFDGAELSPNDPRRWVHQINNAVPLDLEWQLTPAAGSHLIGVTSWVSANSITITASAGAPLTFTVEEDIRPNTNNS